MQREDEVLLVLEGAMRDEEGGAVGAIGGKDGAGEGVWDAWTWLCSYADWEEVGCVRSLCLYDHLVVLLCGLGEGLVCGLGGLGCARMRIGRRSQRFLQAGTVCLRARDFLYQLHQL